MTRYLLMLKIFVVVYLIVLLKHVIAGKVVCNLCEHNFTLILATGRSGSTTLLEMVNQLPGHDLSGEQAGQFNDLFSLYKHFSESQRRGRGSNGHGAWANRHEGDLPFLCWIQEWYFTHVGSRRDNPNIRVHGFKEIRYHSPDILHFLKKVFPCGKFVVNYRNDLAKQHQSKFHRQTSLNDLGKMTDNLIEFSREFPSSVYRMPLENFSNITVWNTLFSWLGSSNCKATSVAWANNHSYEVDLGRYVKCENFTVS